MARARKRKEAPGRFETLLDDMLGSGINVILETARKVTPKCIFCGASTIFYCDICGRHVCQAHGYVNVKQLNMEGIRTSCLCCGCLSKTYDFVRIEPPPYILVLLQDWEGKKYPWEILGLSWTTTEKEINDHYKTRAKKAHPDAGGSHERMSLLSKAREWMIRNKEHLQGGL